MENMTINKKTVLNISGMHCASCAILISRSLQDISGVKQANVNYANEQALIEHSDDVTEEQLIKIIKNSGYNVIQKSESDDDDFVERKRELDFKKIKRKLIISSILTLLLIIGSMFPFSPAILKNPFIMLLLATPVQFWVGYQYYRSAWSGLQIRSANMDTLIALGTSVAYFFSLVTLLFMDKFESMGLDTHVYFETSSAIITLILFGKFLETRAKGQTSEAIKKLIGLQVKTARVLKEGKEILAPIDQVVIGDIIIVKPGDKIPLDGEIIEGNSYVDESMITGESMAIHKTVGMFVIGSTMNKSGSFQFKVTKVGSDTLLSQIIEMVRQSQGSRASVQKLVDQISSYFVPTVIILSLLTFLYWFNFGNSPTLGFALLNTISVLIISCPCALGLATPTSIMVGMGIGAQKGILIKDAQSLEIATKVKYVVFDKTGTLTSGKSTVKTIEFKNDVSNKEDILSLILSTEMKSHHPLAESIVKHLEGKQVKLISEFEDISGLGVRSLVEGHSVLVGNIELMKSFGVNVVDDLVGRAEELRKGGQTVSFVSVDKEHVALIGISDSIKEGAKEVLAELKNMGITSVMLTGDNRITAEAVAKELNLDLVFAEVLPNNKADKITELQHKGKNRNIVAMVGDGINDAPALATSDIAFAMGSGTDIAIESSGITLLRGDISLVPKAINLSRLTMRNIKQNLFWAFGYNLLLIPVAMGVLFPFFGILLSPMFAGGAMALSSLSVVTNALRLRNAKI